MKICYIRVISVPCVWYVNEIYYLCTKIKTMEILQATIEDRYFVAKGIAMALHLNPDEEELKNIAGVCEREDVLYSYRNALIAFDGETPLGLCLAYDGTGYHEIRLRTFALFSAFNEETEDDMDFEHFEDETSEGEYYIDSLAVMPEYRRKGIAKELMNAQIEKGRQLGIKVATLLVDPANPDAQELYYKLGFKYSSDVYAFGQIFWKFSKPL